MKIQNIIAREIFDSRGNPTVECEMIFENISYPFLTCISTIHNREGRFIFCEKEPFQRSGCLVR